MKHLTTLELKEAIEQTFTQPFEELISRKFAENNYAKYLFIKSCRDKGMSFSIIAKHLNMSYVAASRYMTDEYVPDKYVVELFQNRFKAILNSKLNTK